LICTRDARENIYEDFMDDGICRLSVRSLPERNPAPDIAVENPISRNKSQFFALGSDIYDVCGCRNRGRCSFASKANEKQYRPGAAKLTVTELGLFVPGEAEAICL
jgi:hypothetical protein